MSGSGLRRDRVVELLAELERRLAERGLSVKIRVVGGSALLLHSPIDRATEDIDAYYSHRVRFFPQSKLLICRPRPP
ncbi:DUF6036 family nucleotidyltransferase [Glutamicibacter mishrai]|uniref:DUF6036 family nucleotidyltransferase n=1 Tax=Glutamicibacter mishrai TaxID=1775880 RepID=UPI0020CC2296|nr:DUF6036 family nucleotidyltransferase [Glutamicibacter mishrai]UTT40181.1 DUF6036 family nucleotidyltransferase [Glutamicibacter mishrai]